MACGVLFGHQQQSFITHAVRVVRGGVQSAAANTAANSEIKPVILNSESEFCAKQTKPKQLDIISHCSHLAYLCKSAKALALLSFRMLVFCRIEDPGLRS